MVAYTYSVDLALAGDETGALATDLKVMALEDLSRLRVEALLGRDVLERCLLVYNGVAGQFTLAFDAPARRD